MILISKGFIRIRMYPLVELREAFGRLNEISQKATFSFERFSKLYKKYAKEKRKFRYKYGKHTQRARKARK